uniref:Gustatory receptor n=1 Tax=Anopheles dirus TaxID=7168 RepID=A0A182NZ65_9DIPT
MAWHNTEKDRIRHLLLLTIGPTMRVSQLLSLAPYPLTLLQGDRCMDGNRIQVVIFFRSVVAISATIVTLASQFVLFFFYPNLLYQPTVPIFIVILYYIVSVLQGMTVAKMLIGCERRRAEYEGYFAEVLPLVKETVEQSDCQLTIRQRNVAKALLAFYSTVALLLPCVMATVLQDIGSIPYSIAQFVPFGVSYLILVQYYCVYVHLSAILRKLNERLAPIVNNTSSIGTHSAFRAKPVVYNILGQPLPSSKPGINHQDQIEQLRLLHVKVMEIAGHLSVNFGVVIILIVVAAFASVNIDLLELYQCIKLGNLGPVYIVLKFLFAAIKFSFYVLIAYPNRMIQNEIEHYISQLVNVKDVHEACGMITLDMKLITNIEHYISQISNLHDIQQVCGMITLYMKLVCNVVVAITSIMVVLIQFADSGL